MTEKYTLLLGDRSATIKLVGGKGESLNKMIAAGFPVPAGFQITTSAYRRFVDENDLQQLILNAVEQANPEDPESLEYASNQIRKLFNNSRIPADIIQAVILAFEALPGSPTSVAVRSSATAEDLPGASFAGQQETYLNISDEEMLLEAIRKCWASLWTARGIGYRSRQGFPSDSVSLAVIVQLLVPAKAAGIMFTANPVNGSRDEIVINASWGLGEAVVAGLVSPDTIIVDRSSGMIITRQVSEKLLQTVATVGGTKEVPVPEKLQSAPVLYDRQVKALAELGKDIESFYKVPMDIEWALAGGKFSIVQARPITALPEPELSAPKVWQLPEGAYAAMRNNIVELMTEPLSPLFRTLGLSAVNMSMGGLLSGFLGNQGVMPGDLIIAVNDYAYYNGSVKFRPMLKIILDTPGILKRMFRGAVERWTQEGRPRYIETVSKWRARDLAELSSAELLSAVHQLTEAAVDAYGSLVSGVIPAAWISEAWFTFIYKLLKQKGDPTAATYLMGFDSLPIRADKALYKISQWVLEHQDLAGYLEESPVEKIVAELNSTQIPAGMNKADWLDWRNRVDAHLQEFGHTIYNLDFANPVPADDPAAMLETLKMYMHGRGTNPFTRQIAAGERREQATHRMQEKLQGWGLNLFQKNLDRAQRYAPLREDGLADVGLGYPIIRQILFELGRRFSEAGLIAEPDEIFWLEQDEIEAVAAKLDQGQALSSLANLIPQRKTRLKAAERAEPPLALFRIKIFGIKLLEMNSSKGRRGQESSLKGVAASPGTVTAAAVVLHGPQDFSKMRPGNVLVASITTPAWTPLFARAAAVVTDIGGPLSHGSIVAREYGIPAVLGTDSATKKIQDGQIVRVDGNTGMVTLIQNA